MKRGVTVAMNYIRNHLFLCSIVLGALIMSVWTLLRFFHDPSIFDLVGQQVYAHELLMHGAGDARLGATHYLVKIFLIYIPFQWLHLDPRAALMIMTLLVNSVSYILIATALRRVAIELKINVGAFFYAGLLWLAAFAGSLFWIEFTNSRNLEVAAGVWLIAWGLQLLRQPTRHLAILFGVLAMITLYSDPLQVVMTALPLATYILYRIMRRLTPSRRGISIIVLIILAYGLSLVLRKVTEATLGVSFADTTAGGGGIVAVLHDVSGAIQGVATANIRLLIGVVDDGGRVRQLVAALAIIATMSLWVIAAMKKWISQEVVVFVGIFAVIIELVYVASGQSVNGDTSRYLIMVAPLIVIVIASLANLKVARRLGLGILCGVIAINSLFALGLMIQAWPQRFTQDASLKLIATYVAQQPSVQFYAGMDVALPTDYFYPDHTILPLVCQSGRLQQATSFYPQTSFRLYANRRQTSDAIIVQNGAFTNYPNVCTHDDIVSQFGQPQRIQNEAPNQEVLYYQPNAILPRL